MRCIRQNRFGGGGGLLLKKCGPFPENHAKRGRKRCKLCTQVPKNGNFEVDPTHLILTETSQEELYGSAFKTRAYIRRFSCPCPKTLQICASAVGTNFFFCSATASRGGARFQVVWLAAPNRRGPRPGMSHNGYPGPGRQWTSPHFELVLVRGWGPGLRLRVGGPALHG